MRFTISAPSLTQPTFETLEEYAAKRFKKIEKLLTKDKQADNEVHISVKKEKYTYELMVEIFFPEHIVIVQKDKDIRRVVDLASDTLKQKLAKEKDKRVDLRRLKEKIHGLSGKLKRR